MTEKEWLVSTDPWRMLHVVQRSGPSERKVRLFNAAVCRRFWEYLPEESQAILVESERLADAEGSSSSEDLVWRANGVAGRIDQRYPNKQFPSAAVRIQRDAAAAVCYAVAAGELWGAVSYFWDIDPAEQGGDQRSPLPALLPCLARSASSAMSLLKSSRSRSD
jgi:hypothetical protein